MSYLATDVPLSKALASPSTVIQESEPVAIPEKFPGDWGIALLLFAGSSLYFHLFYNYTTLNVDEGIVLQGAQRILEGQVLYRDFFSLFTPGSYYWMALFFRVFGSSILVGRTVLIVEGGLLSVLTYLVARRVCLRWCSLLVACLATLVCLPYRFVVVHNWDSTLWAYVALYSAVWFTQRPHWAWAFVTGLFTALTCLFEQSKGAGLVLGLGVGFLILLCSERDRAGWSRRTTLASLVGFLGPFLLTFVYFRMEHGLPQLLEDWFWPLHHYSSINKVPFGFLVESLAARDILCSGNRVSRSLTLLITGPWFLIPILPFLIAGNLACWTAKLWRGKRFVSKASYYVLCSAASVGLLVSTLATGRPDFTHLLYLTPLFFLALAWIFDGRDIPSSLLRAVKPLLVFLLSLSFAAFGLSLLWQPLNGSHTLQTRRGALKAPNSDNVLDYLQTHVFTGERMLVYPSLPLYYYLTATSNPTRHEFLVPGYHSARQFWEVVNELADDHTRVVLLEPSFRERMVAGLPSASPEMLAARDPVAEYIAKHYRACASLTSQGSWRFTFMVRKDLDCPGSSSGMAERR